VRAVLALTMVPLLGCSTLLGIEEPTGIDGGGMDGIDAPGGEHLLFNVPDFQLAQLQSARVHVVLVHTDTSMVDVTQTATYKSDNEPLVAIGGPGVIKSIDTQSGSATITASLDGAASATVKVSVKTTLCHPVINELQTAGASSADEWVEIYNPCTMPVPVDGWTLDYRAASNAGATDGMLLVTLTGTIAAGDFRLYAGAGYVGPPSPDDSWGGGSGGALALASGAVGLRGGPISMPPLVDSVGYGTTVASLNPFLESTAAPTMSAGVSASRAPFDGKDDDDGKNDFKVTPTPTPRALNEP
jgi:hypothetical protein